MESKIYIIHENAEWTKPLIEALEELNLPYEDWFVDEGQLNLTKEPPVGVFYNRMSASSHTRGHRYAPEYTSAILSWLESYDRKVINNSRALALEVSKVAQYVVLNRYGVDTPKTIAAIGKDEIISAAKQFDGPFITKHNRAGKGLGVQLFKSVEALEEYVNGTSFEEPIDGITLIQQYIEAPEPFITRCEFVGREFLYAVRVNTSEGFQLCPADVCQVDDAFCPVGEEQQSAKFKIIENFENPIIDKYIDFLSNNGIHIAGIEFIQDKNGKIYTYDVNTNTNYNPDAQEIAGMYGMKDIAKYLGRELDALKG